MNSKYFHGVDQAAIKSALRLWADVGFSINDFRKITPSAGKPHSEFIDMGSSPPAPIKAIVKQAMIQSDIDPTTNFRKKFTSDNAKSFLARLGYTFISLSDHEQSDLDEIARQRELYEELARPNQVAFRNAAISFFGGKCAITDCSCVAALEAAHIKEFAAGGPDVKENSLLLRADLHRLFDRNLLKIHPLKGTVVLFEDAATSFPELVGVTMNKPTTIYNFEIFRDRWEKV